MNKTPNEKTESRLDKLLSSKVCAFALLGFGLATGDKVCFLLMALFAVILLFNKKDHSE